MDLKGSLVNNYLKIYPSQNLINYLKTIPITDDLPIHILKVLKGNDYEPKRNNSKEPLKVNFNLNKEDIHNLNKIKVIVNSLSKEEENKVTVDDEKENNANFNAKSNDKINEDKSSDLLNEKSDSKKNLEEEIKESEDEELPARSDPYILTSDIDWLYANLQSKRKQGNKDVPYLHVLLEGSDIVTPENETIKRNPALEARCVKLRAQQEAREYKKMTKTVDNVRMRFPEDSISYQMKQLNRQLIAIGQFIISIFAGFLFGFRGVEWIVGNLDFGFRLLLGVMCALVIALAEIYFLAKKLNEELNIPETVQLGGPVKLANEPPIMKEMRDEYAKKAAEKEHKD